MLTAKYSVAEFIISFFLTQWSNSYYEIMKNGFKLNGV